MFIDKVKIPVLAGKGGDGIVSFRHEKYVDKGGPDGGDGGDGGDIVMVASRNQDTLATFRYQKRLQADNGGNGGKRRKHGKRGQNLEVAVPVGTVITAGDGSVMADLTEDGQRVVVVRGGSGGFGNAHFTSSTRQAPRIVEKGEPGEEDEVVLELKMIADVGLVGLPNAGKSTLLARISNAKPEIANYPFTTLIPNLGVVDASSTSLLVADIPGLIEGASQGKGLGDEFLRHVERTNVLLHLIDAYSDDIAASYRTIQQELTDYKPDLSKRPQVVVLTKVEGLDKEIVADIIRQLQKVVPSTTKIIAISSQSGDGLAELIKATVQLVQKQRKARMAKAKKAVPVLTFEEPEDRWNITTTEGGFIVTGKKIQSFARRIDFSDYYGQERMRDILRKNGVINALVKKSIEPGQKIIIGDPKIGELEY